MTVLTLRRQGNSLGFTLPSDEVKRLGLHPGDRVDIQLTKVPSVSSLAGILKAKLGDIDQLLHESDAFDKVVEDRRLRQLDRDVRKKRGT